MKNEVLFISTSNLSHNQSMSTRVWYISNALNKCGIPTKIIGKKSESNDMEGCNIITIKPLLNGFLGELVFRIVQLPIFVILTLFSEQIKDVILRGYDLIFIAFFLRIIGKNVIYDFHGYRYKEQELENRLIRSKITKIFERIIFLTPNKIISVSEGIREQLPKKYRQKTIILSNGVDLELFKNDEFENKIFEKYLDKKIVGFVGRWGPDMNIKDILDVSSYCDNIQILIVGNGYNFEQLVELTKFNSSIKWTGMVNHDKSIEYLKLMDICITPYSKDIHYANEPGFFEARKNKEYLAAGKPIIMGNIKGREQFVEGENVLLYEPGNPEDLANKIRLLLTDKLLYQKIHENNKKLSKEFSWEKLLEKSGLIFILRSQET